MRPFLLLYFPTLQSDLCHFYFELMISNFLHAVLMWTLVTGQWCVCLSVCRTRAGANVFSLIAALLYLLLLKVFFGAFRPISKSRV